MRWFLNTRSATVDEQQTTRIVQVGAVGICGSDVHYLKHMRCADFVVEKPMVIGHEAAGVVAEVGAARLVPFQESVRNKKALV